MKVCIIYHSETGNTRHVARHLASVFDTKLVEVCEVAEHSRLTRFLVWCKMARGEDLTKIKPEAIDVSGYDLLVFGSPVWAFKPTPAIHSAINALSGCEGKPAVAFSTHGGTPGQTEATYKKWIGDHGIVFKGFAGIHQNDVEDENKMRELVTLIKSIQKTNSPK